MLDVYRVKGSTLCFKAVIDPPFGKPKDFRWSIHSLEDDINEEDSISSRIALG